ncbi:MAG: hypothetical protein ACLSB9_35835 [Hydrogeniiclostridium mannosilyticum]
MDTGLRDDSAESHSDHHADSIGEEEAQVMFECRWMITSPNVLGLVLMRVEVSKRAKDRNNKKSQ